MNSLINNGNSFNENFKILEERINSYIKLPKNFFINNLINKDFISPNLNLDIILDYTSGELIFTLYAPYNMKIISITNIKESPAILIVKNDIPYVLGENINIGDKLDIAVSDASVIRLNILKI